MPQKRMECFRLLLEHLEWIEHQFLSGIRDSRKEGSLWGIMRGVGGVRKSIHQSWLAKGLGLGLLCWGSSWCSGNLRWKLDLLLWPRDKVPSGSILALPDPRRPDRTNPSTNFFWQHWHDLHALGSHWTDNQHRILWWGLKGVQQEIPSEEASTLQIGSVAFPPGQCTSSQLHPCHRLFDQDGHQDSSSPSRPCSLWLLFIP